MSDNNFRRAAASSSSTVHGQDLRNQQIAQWVESVLQNESLSSSSPSESPMLQDHNFSSSSNSILGFPDCQVGGKVRPQENRACNDPRGNVEHVPQFYQPPQQQHGQFPHPQINSQFSQLPQQKHGHFIQHQQEYGQFLQHQVNGQFLHQPPQQHSGQFIQKQVNCHIPQQQQHGSFLQKQQGNGQFLQQQERSHFPKQQQHGHGQFMQQQQHHTQYVEQQGNGEFPHQQRNGQFSQQQQQLGQFLPQKGNNQFLRPQHQQVVQSVQPAVRRTGASSSSSQSESESELPMLPEYCISSSSILQSPPNCQVCGEVRPLKNGKEPGLAYEAIACTSCQQFFKRSKNWEQDYKCKGGGAGGTCRIRVDDRRCRLCRIHKCLDAGMDWPPEVKEGTYEPCVICYGTTSKLGTHYGVKGSCEGCKCFFLRVTKTKNVDVACTCKKCETCIRYQNCLDAGMDRTKIKRGRPCRKNI